MSDRRLVYELEERLQRSALRSHRLYESATIALLHLSTIPHLTIFLEEVLSRNPRAEIVISSWKKEEEIEASYTHWRLLRKDYKIRMAPPPDFAGSLPSPRSTVMLYSSKALPPTDLATPLRKKFLFSRAPEKIIIHGDGTLWDGRFLPRLERKYVSMRLAKLQPERDREELRLLEEAIPADAGYNTIQASELGEPNPEKRTRLIDYPIRIECEPETGNAIKPRFIARPADAIARDEGYQVRPFLDEYRDWAGSLRRYQERRARNMEKLGLSIDIGRQVKTALDYGCGTGGLAALLAEKGWHTLGVDLSRESIARARLSFKKPVFDFASPEDLRQRGNSFDLITLSHVLETCPDDVGTLRSLAAILKQSGKIYIESPWFDRDALKHRPLWYRQRDNVREYTKMGLYSVVTRAGFRVIKHSDSLHDDGNEPYQFLLAETGLDPDIDMAI